MFLRRVLFRNFHLVYRTDQWIKRRFTHTGMFLIGALVLSGVFGVNTRATFSYQLITLVVAVLIVAGMSGLSFRGRFELVRRLPRFATAGEPLHYSVYIRNLSRRVQSALLAREVIPVKPPSTREFDRRREPADARRNWFDRRVGYPRWVGLMRWRRGASSVEVRLPDLPPGEWIEAPMRLLPHRRGFVRLRAALISRVDPLGVFKALCKSGPAEALLVLPRRYQVSWSDLLGRSQDRIGRKSEATSTGGAEEFASLREYRPGDPLRHIHWKGWARLGEPVVREFHEECFVRQGLVLDTFLPARASDQRFEEAVSVAASFADAAPVGAGMLELVFVGAEVCRIPSGQGTGAADRLLEALACVEATPEQPFARLEEAVLAHAGELSACVCVLLAWDEARRDFVARLKALGVPLLVLVVSEEDAGDALEPGPMADCPDRLKKLRLGRVQADLVRAGAAEAIAASGRGPE